MGDVGFEPDAVTTFPKNDLRNTTFLDAAKSAACSSTADSEGSKVDPGLDLVVAAWPHLGVDGRKSIRQLVWDSAMEFNEGHKQETQNHLLPFWFLGCRRCSRVG